ncbi:hypothetical protein [Nocardia sp. CA-145437]|uniref:hypothetical protein n=1 Tax=Nocardia sp. CA-145437 TaxID=3239980 RepID=UPI003D98A3D9
MTTRKKSDTEPKTAVRKVNPIVKKAAEQVQAAKARKVARWGKDFRGDCSGQFELDLFPPTPKPRRRRS